MFEGGVIGIGFGRELVITEVVSGGPADIAGLKRGDRIEELGGRTVTSYENALLAMADTPGSSVEIAVTREGTVHFFTIERSNYKDVYGMRAVVASEMTGDIGEREAPKVIKKVEPEYPANLRRQRIQGRVVVESRVDTTGVPRDIRVVKSDHPALSDLAVRAIAQWRYQPGTVDGKPVDLLFQNTVTFSLDN